MPGSFMLMSKTLSSQLKLLERAWEPVLHCCSVLPAAAASCTWSIRQDAIGSTEVRPCHNSTDAKLTVAVAAV